MIYLTHRVNWLRFKKSLSSLYTENIRLQRSEDVESNADDLSEKIKHAAEHATTTHPQTGFKKIYSADIERLLCE